MIDRPPDTSSRSRLPLVAGIGSSAFLLLLLVAVLGIVLSLDPTGGEHLFATLRARDWQTVQITTLQAGLSTALSVAIGLLLAWALSHQRAFIGRRLLIALLSSALVLPTLVVVLGLVSVLGRNGWASNALQSFGGSSLGSFLFGLTGILIAHVYLNASFAVRTLLNRLEAIPPEKRKLARALGLSTWKRFRILEWPAVASAIPGLSSTIFLLCFTSFAIVLTLGGSPRYNTLEVAIFEAVKLDFNLARAVDLALLQLCICAALIMAATGLRNAAAVTGTPTSHFFWPEPDPVKRFQVAVITALGLAFILPLTAIILDGARADYSKLIGEAAFRQALVTSLIIATASSALTVLASLALANARRHFLLPSRLGLHPAARNAARVVSFSASLYLAVPALVMGLGFFLIARQLPGSLNQWAIVAVLTANTLLALPFGMALLAPAMEKSAQKYDRLAASLGLGLIKRWKIIEWPMLRSDIGYLAALAFCFSLGDLGVIALFGNQDFATLPWYLYQKMGSYRTDDAAGVALVMLSIVLIVFFLLPLLARDRTRTDGHRHADT